jgi:glycosyltransferase involved in cell wall biosynthesis
MNFSSNLPIPPLKTSKAYNSAYVHFCQKTQLHGGTMTANAAIIYWGSRGGGPRLLLNLAHSAKKGSSQLFFYISSNNELSHEIQSVPEINLNITQIPGSKIGQIFNIYARENAVTNVLADLESKSISRVYFLMPHPWDLYLAKRIDKAGKIQVWRGIHDLRRHPGDIWPNVFTIRKLIKYSTTLVCFSSYIEKQLLRYGKPVLRSHLFEVSRKPKRAFSEGSVLFVGRIRKYKGLTLLAKAWPLVLNTKKSLTVAGDGRVPQELNKIDMQIINKWLTNSEIENLVNKSNLVVLPYIEASQSGVIAIAHSLSTPVVITPVGGLVDQVIDGKNGLIAAQTTPKALAMAIDAALTRNWALELEENPLPNFLSKLQMD